MSTSPCRGFSWDENPWCDRFLMGVELFLDEILQIVECFFGTFCCRLKNKVLQTVSFMLSTSPVRGARPAGGPVPHPMPAISPRRGIRRSSRCSSKSRSDSDPRENLRQLDFLFAP